MKTKYKHIYFEKAASFEDLIWICYSNKGDIWLGSIPKKKVWRQYVFEPGSDCIFNNGCLRDIADFLDQLN